MRLMILVDARTSRETKYFLFKRHMFKYDDVLILVGHSRFKK